MSYHEFILLLVAAIWGMGFVAADIAMEQLPPMLISAVRFSIAASFFYIIIRKRLKAQFPKPTELPKRREVAKFPWGPGFVVGFFLALGFILQTMALRYTTPAKNAFLTSTNVIITPFIYFLLTRRSLAIKTISGAILAIIGIALLSFDGHSLRIDNVGDLLTLLCALFFALHIYSTGYYLKEKNLALEPMVLLQFVFAAGVSWISVLLWEDIPLRAFVSQSGLAVLFLGLFSTMLCFFLQTFAQRKVNQNKAAVILSLEALFGTLFAVWLRGEVLNRYMLLGFAVMLCAILVTEWPNRVSPRP